jgi:hypothetical protein
LTSFRPSKDATLLAGLYALAWLLPAFVGGYAILTMFPFHPLPVPDFTPIRHDGAVRFFFDPWQDWDGQWYLRIADRGYYAGDASPAFLPAYPLAIRGLAVLTGGDLLVAACLVSWASLALALVVLHRLFLEELGEETAANALVLLVTFPTAFYFHAAYTESFFLLCSSLSLLLARRGRFALAAMAALLASLTRWTGFALVPALLVEAWTQSAAATGALGDETPTLERLWNATATRVVTSVSRSAVALSLFPLVALPLVLQFLQTTVGDPWAFSRAQRLWERRLTPPWTGLIEGIRVVLPGHPPYLSPLPGGFPRLADYPGGFLTAHGYNLAAALLGLTLATVAAYRLRASLAVLALVEVILPLMTPSRLQPLQSMPRFLVVAFPLFAALSVLLRGRPTLSAAVVGAFACLQGFFAARFALWFWVA